MQYTLAAVSLLAAGASAAPAPQGAPAWAPTRLQVSLQDINSSNDHLKQFDGYYVARVKSGPPERINYVSLSTSEPSDFVDTNNWQTQDGFYLKFPQMTGTSHEQPMKFDRENDMTFNVVDGYAQGTFRTFSGWLVCSDMGGPYLEYTETGFKENTVCARATIKAVNTGTQKRDGCLRK